MVCVCIYVYAPVFPIHAHSRKHILTHTFPSIHTLPYTRTCTPPHIHPPHTHHHHTHTTKGRVKTLHPGVHGGILARRDTPGHMDAIAEHNIQPIDIVIVNLYPFRATVTAEQAPSYEVAIENIDIGGPAMIRAAAKNHAAVTVVVDPADYSELLQQLSGGLEGEEGLAFRKRCAWKAFQHCATYDSTVAEWMWTQVGMWVFGWVGGFFCVGQYTKWHTTQYMSTSSHNTYTSSQTSYTIHIVTQPLHYAHHHTTQYIYHTHHHTSPPLYTHIYTHTPQVRVLHLKSVYQ